MWAVAAFEAPGPRSTAGSLGRIVPLSLGFEVVGWHCPQENVGSIRTAEKVGFELERAYEAHIGRLT